MLPLFSIYFHGYVNPKWYDGLSAANQAAIDEAGKKAGVWAIEASEEAAGIAPGQLTAAGMNVHIATEAENAALKAVMGPAFDKAFGEASGDDGKKLLELIGKM